MENTSPSLLVAVSPHLRSRMTSAKIMWLVVIALLPALGGAIYFYGLRALWITALSTVSGVVFDALGQLMFGRRPTPQDGSGAVTGLLLAFNLPPGVPWWLPVVGAAFAVIVVKQFFGGLGHNFVNPALAARAFLMVSWPTHMTAMWLHPAGNSISGLDSATLSRCTDAITSATPLNVLKNGSSLVGEGITSAELWRQLQSWDMLKRLFLGQVGGSLGETSALLLLIGGALLLALRVIDWRIPASYLGTVIILALVLPGHKANPVQYALFHSLAGGLFLGALFMATDYVTSPLTDKGRIIFGAGCGILTVLIRLWGGYPEGVCYSILLMNVATPLIDRFTRPKLFGERKDSKG